ncbi:ATP phosphoribosyltransferase regulatory subunit [Babesia caballi]|uniref:ATP phosphoribosyltransferase regulatory subunit n=1 Tax=Babesia caballi TaxID=5871 RepID=A0AAV4LR15_BABCB|nr:ATP phosphoribosyltransferase regulatory subunit [Babesia caballi]
MNTVITHNLLKAFTQPLKQYPKFIREVNDPGKVCLRKRWRKGGALRKSEWRKVTAAVSVAAVALLCPGFMNAVRNTPQVEGAGTCVLTTECGWFRRIRRFMLDVVTSTLCIMTVPHQTVDNIDKMSHGTAITPNHTLGRAFDGLLDREPGVPFTSIPRPNEIPIKSEPVAQTSRHAPCEARKILVKLAQGRSRPAANALKDNVNVVDWVAPSFYG